MSQKDEIRDSRMDPPSGYGAFDEEELYSRDEDAEEEPLSDCCTASIIYHDICSQCGEHI